MRRSRSPELLGEGDAPKIRIIPNKTAGTLTIADNGIGMERQELIDNLGTIARSGTKAFVAKLAEAKDGARPDRPVRRRLLFRLHGRRSDRRHQPPRRRRARSGAGRPPAAPASRSRPPAKRMPARVARGTEIVLHLKDDAKKYLETYEIERIVGAYSDNILFPIELVPEEGEPRQINSASALWQRSKSELTAEDYKQGLSSQIANAFDEPAMTLHYRAEGRYSYAVLLFAPSTKPFDLFEPARKGRVKLYVRRVFITDDADLLPGLSALHPRRDRQRRPAAQHLARDAAEQSAARADPEGRARPASSPSWKARREGAGEFHQDLGRLRRSAEGRHLRGFRAAREAAGAVALHHHLGRAALAEAIRRRSQAEPDRNLLSGRRQHRAAEVQSAAGSGDRARHRGAAADRCRRCLLDLGAARSSTASR